MIRLLRILSFYLTKRGIDKYKIISPVLVSREGVILDGNRRVMAAKELGIKIPVVKIDANIEYIDPKELIISCPRDLNAPWRT